MVLLTFSDSLNLEADWVVGKKFFIHDSWLLVRLARFHDTHECVHIWVMMLWCCCNVLTKVKILVCNLLAGCYFMCIMKIDLETNWHVPAFLILYINSVKCKIHPCESLTKQNWVFFSMTLLVQELLCPKPIAVQILLGHGFQMRKVFILRRCNRGLLAFSILFSQR